ncbi:hypothetical protein NM208_g14133 [Fusarium decemcellulare]|uniref:Uncharacterized protein n=1 Tax=Fusarium decemcellulare TaxID=57161 RepID=A0ACC1RIN5_9HYPO|nr:hypothetical protein NM208_g14133 [Fusarium decemcellulare]
MASPDRIIDARLGTTLQDLLCLPDAHPLLEEKLEPPIKFDIPPDCRVFSPFARLPPEIRYQIWENTLATPGMHFLKIDTDYQPTSGAGRWWTKEWTSIHAHSEDDDEDADPITLEVKRESRPNLKQYGTLKPLYPTRQADISYYTNLHQQLAKLSVTCNEAASIAKSLTCRSTTFRLDNGRIISLDCSSDVIYLEYVPPAIFEDGFRFFRALECSGLDQIRRVAVRYCHKWYEQHSPRRCPNCGQIHQTPDRVKYPNHLYRFMAQYLPNLEHFYFVDYFILRKPSDASSPPVDDGRGFGTLQKAKPRLSKFQGGNRTYYEVDDQDWNVQSKVFQMKSWLEDNFTKYAKSSKLSKHRSPEKVKFGVLACEWTVGPPAEAKKVPTTPEKKGRNKRTHCEEHTSWRNRRSPVQKSPASIPGEVPTDVTGRIPFIFGAPTGNRFDFTFSIPL